MTSLSEWLVTILLLTVIVLLYTAIDNGAIEQTLDWAIHNIANPIRDWIKS